MANRPKGPLRGLLQLMWRQLVWSIPFALFFGVVNDSGRGLGVYVLAFKMSLVFAYSIGLALWAVRYFVEPRLTRHDAVTAQAHVLRIGGAYIASAVVGSYVAAFIVHFTLLHGFLGSPRAVIVSGLYTLLFCALFGAFNFAVVFYHHAVDRARAVEMMRAELAAAELRALRAQINPHFLFNTLNSIAALIRIDPNAAEDTTTRLADVFRYALRASDHTHVRLGDELEFVREYLSIERTRFTERLRFAEDIEPGLSDLEVPSLLLQPLVENAVRYAVSPRLEGGSIRLAARRDGELLTLTVQDDGPGIDPNGRASGTGFGLHSVRERMRAAGPPHDLHIRTGPGQGTAIDVVLPVLAGRGNSKPAPTPRGGLS